MKRKVVITTLVLVALLLSSILVNSQESKTQLIVVWENSVIPSMADKYESSVKKQIQLMEKHNYPIPFKVYLTDDFLYYWSTPIKNVAEFEKLASEWYSFYEKMKEDGFDQAKELKGTRNYVKTYFINWIDASSYNPEESRFDMSKNHYLRWCFCYLHSGQEKDFYEKHDRYIKEFKTKKPISGYSTYEFVFGLESPGIIWIERYKNPVDMWETREKIFESLGQEVFNIWEEMKNDIRKFETKTGWYRADLSYIPKE